MKDYTIMIIYDKEIKISLTFVDRLKTIAQALFFSEVVFKNPIFSKDDTTLIHMLQHRSLVINYRESNEYLSKIPEVAEVSGLGNNPRPKSFAAIKWGEFLEKHMLTKIPKNTKCIPINETDISIDNFGEYGNYPFLVHSVIFEIK